MEEEVGENFFHFREFMEVTIMNLKFCCLANNGLKLKFWILVCIRIQGIEMNFIFSKHYLKKFSCGVKQSQLVIPVVLRDL